MKESNSESTWVCSLQYCYPLFCREFDSYCGWGNFDSPPTCNSFHSLTLSTNLWRTRCSFFHPQLSLEDSLRVTEFSSHFSRWFFISSIWLDEINWKHFSPSFFVSSLITETQTWVGFFSDDFRTELHHGEIHAYSKLFKI